MFESLYGSAWHHPGSFWLISGLFLAALVLQRPRQGGEARILWWLTLLLLAEISLDAWITTDSWSPLPNDSMVKGNLAIAFVIAGDQRYVIRGRVGANRMTENYFTLWDPNMGTVDARQECR